MTNITYKQTRLLADEYLQLKAEKADLARRERALKTALEGMAASKLDAMETFVVEGFTGRVSVIPVLGGFGYDRKLLEAHVPAATLELCRKDKADSVRFDVRARVGEAAA